MPAEKKMPAHDRLKTPSSPNAVAAGRGVRTPAASDAEFGSSACARSL